MASVTTNPQTSISSSALGEKPFGSSFTSSSVDQSTTMGSQPSPPATTASPQSQTTTAVSQSPPSSAGIDDDPLLLATSASSATTNSANAPTRSTSGDLEVDDAILQALRSPKERLYMLKLGETMENLINERSATKPFPRTTLLPTTTYHRLLVHRSCGYYKLTADVDAATKSITVIVTKDSRIPSRRVVELVPLETSGSQPTFKIIRRATPEHRNKGRNAAPSLSASSSLTDISPSAAGAVASAPDADVAKPEAPSPANSSVEDGSDEILRSLGLPPKQSRSNTGANTPRKTIEEREAAYAEARNRIFKGFEAEEKAAAKLREDRERAREVTELHRELAEQDDTDPAPIVLVGAPTTSGRPNSRSPAAGGLTAPNSHSNVRDRVPRGNARSPAFVTATGDDSFPSFSSDPSLPAVNYPSLYDNANTESDGTLLPPTQPYPTNQLAPPFEPTSSSYNQPSQNPYAGNPYPHYPAGGMPPMNNAPSMMNPYTPYQNMPPQQSTSPHMGMGPAMMGMMQYPYYPPPSMGPPPPNWGDNSAIYSPPNPPDGQGVPPEEGYGMFTPPMQHPPTFWTPSPPQAQMGPGQVPDMSHNFQSPLNGQGYPQGPYYNPNMPPPQYPPSGNPYASPPLPPHPSQFQPNYPPNQRPPPQPLQPSRQLWSPNNAKRDLNSRSNHSNGQHRQGGGRNGGTGNGSGSNGRNQGPNRNHTLRDPNQTSRDFSNGPASLIATPMSGSSSSFTGPRSRNSSISASSATGPHLGMSSIRNIWSTNANEDIPPLGMNGLRFGSTTTALSGRIPLGDRRRSGSHSGSVSESVSVIGDESGAMTPFDETASMASSSMSSTSSSRTFTSSSSKHPSLPPRPDWAVGLVPNNRGINGSSPASVSSHSSARGKSGSSSSSSQPAHSRTQSFQSQRPSPYSVLQSNDFPPLPGVASGSVSNGSQRPPALPAGKSSAWNGNSRSALAGPPQQGHDSRFGEQDPKYSRPPPKPTASLFDPKNAGRVVQNNARSTTPVNAQSTSEVGNAVRADNGDGALVDGLNQLRLGGDTAGEPNGGVIAASG